MCVGRRAPAYVVVYTELRAQPVIHTRYTLIADAVTCLYVSVVTRTTWRQSGLLARTDEDVDDRTADERCDAEVERLEAEAQRSIESERQPWARADAAVLAAEAEWEASKKATESLLDRCCEVESERGIYRGGD